jgi:multicomponent Na+:H+ antiporter subunit F
MTGLWLAAALALLPPFALAVVASGRAALRFRLVAVQFATSLATLLLVALSFALYQPATIDLALILAVLTLPGTLLFALFQERWL